MGSAIEAAGGHLDKFIGDGIMALFGLHEWLSRGCPMLWRPAALMSRHSTTSMSRSRRLPRALAHGHRDSCGTGHCGKLGYGRARSMTAVGDAVNTASRLETLTKEFGVQAVISLDVAERAGAGLRARAHHDVPIIGRTEPLTGFAIANAAELAAEVRADEWLQHV